uniref:Uncharacterized protein n=1 Tax=Percolomonas cosmopolitus TaxID=63605 RepID=A0A7S1PI02_9EUKA|mmetsp:Transcript_9603/g.35599  ORF Transcript_9603/g.35599 Transcript_9603/m.35599 type:complete len:210 (+) Transcript_9603:32-661(+)|eukprot:CAMPEP_0117445510 /NCGR_PEP_ID=MMETSP0759-20121206/5835_1 /TAXON_ID=63605 /ORGANISM="Percolomonas cosmopolitus, Strain WS" /LENGTH=209 /DNA_ID=CAMNT_0005237693 /DNA_START=37 /DNA_END=666 /DNA_ORIENTATION=-
MSSIKSEPKPRIVAPSLKRKRQNTLFSFFSSKKAKQAFFGVEKIISGGQCGADQGALEAAYDLKIATGGFAPANFRTEKGSNSELQTKYNLVAINSSDYTKRTRMNVDNSDGTIAFRFHKSRGTDKTIGYAQTKKWTDGKIKSMNRTETQYKPVCVVTQVQDEKEAAQCIREFIQTNRLKVLNVAGHRESQSKDLSGRVKRILKSALAD